MRPSAEKPVRNPYKGLMYYMPDDAELFAGRERDAEEVVRQLSSGTTRLLLLHGFTACGKSSFLRAGLLPAMEREIRGYHFLREAEGDRPLFIRSTNDPVSSVARAVFQVWGNHPPKKLPVLPGGDEIGFARLMTEDPERLAEILEILASSGARTLVVVIDQAEEVVTLNLGPAGEPAMTRFFDFLARLSLSQYDLKMIVTFRTEYHGQFYTRLRSGADVRRVDDYFLAELDRLGIEEAILRPANIERYQFGYEDELAQSIAKDLTEATLTGGILPVMQLVCRRLYERSKLRGEPPWLIRRSDYTRVGGLEGQVDDFLEEELKLAVGEGRVFSALETMRWRQALGSLAARQVNGFVTTSISKESDFEEAARDAGCDMRSFPGILQSLCEEDTRILRRVDVTEAGTQKPISCVSLGHDVLALVLARWMEKHRLFVMRRKFRSAALAVAAVAVCAIGAWWWLRNENAFRKLKTDAATQWNKPVGLILALEAISRRVEPETEGMLQLAFQGNQRPIRFELGSASRPRFNHSGSRLAFGTKISITILNLSDYSSLRYDSLGEVRDLGFSADETLWAAEWTNKGIEIRKYGVADGHPSELIDSISATDIGKIAISPGKHRFAVADGQGDIHLFQAGDKNPKILKGCQAESILDIAFSEDGTIFAAACGDDKNGKVFVWSEDGVMRVTLDHPLEVVASVLPFNGGRRLVDFTASANLWDMTAPPKRYVLQKSGSRVQLSAADAKGERLATVQSESYLSLWDLGSRGELWTFPSPDGPIQHLAISPDGSRLALGNKLGDLRILSLDRGALSADAWRLLKWSAPSLVSDCDKYLSSSRCKTYTDLMKQ